MWECHARCGDASAMDVPRCTALSQEHSVGISSHWHAYLGDDHMAVMSGPLD